MKKILLTLVILLNTVCGYSQVLIRQQNSSSTAIACYVNHGANKVNLRCDTDNNYYLSITHTYMTFEDYIDDYHYDLNNFDDIITVNKHLYIKLDNDSIITLTCTKYLIKEVDHKLKTMKTSVEVVYYTDISSLFKLSDTDVNALKTHDIVKLRAEYNKEFVDVVLEPGNSVYTHDNITRKFELLNLEYNNYKAQLKESINKANEQEKMKNNPLYNF